jgi:hypothetical protein
MHHKKWWWAIFIWGLGVAKVNSYKIYVAMWDEEKKKGRTDLPGKWSHAEFVEQLVYDLIFPEQTMAHRALLHNIDDEHYSIKSRQSLSSFSSSNNLQEKDN